MSKSFKDVRRLRRRDGQKVLDYLSLYSGLKRDLKYRTNRAFRRCKTSIASGGQYKRKFVTDWDYI